MGHANGQRLHLTSQEGSASSAVRGALMSHLVSPVVQSYHVTHPQRRWQNHLRPEVNKGPWTEKEEKLLAKAHA
eukprot:SAG11_NODE_2925_length_2834_cov_2.027788_4_plen_74_part_00